MTTAKPSISVVVPVLNSYRFLRKCLDSIVAAIEFYGNASLTVIDNGSTDGSWEMLSSEYSRVATVRQVKGVTVAALRNTGAKLSDSEYLAFIDSDCLIAPDYLDQAVRVLANTQADAVGCAYSLPDCPNWIEDTWHNLHHCGSRNGAVNYIPAGNFIVSRKAFDAINGFDESLVTGEDAEICQRLWAAKFAVHSSTAISIVHLGNPKTVAHFFRKQVWQGLGMFGTFRGSWYDKPVLMTFAHLFLTIGALLNLLLTPVQLPLRCAISLSLAVLAPAVTVAYRYVSLGRFYRPLRSVFLYCLYLSARVVALFRILGQAVPRQLASKKGNGETIPLE